jgi:hypothetical protein
MRVVAGRRSLGGNDQHRAEVKDNVVVDWDEATTVCPIPPHLVGSSDDVLTGDLAAPWPHPADIDADTVLDERSVDEILLALGTDERRHGQMNQRRVLQVSQPPPVRVSEPLAPPHQMLGTGPIQFQAGPPPPPFGTPYPMAAPHPGAGHYPTGPYAYEVSRPVPVQPKQPIGRLIPALALGLTAVTGILLGKVLFTGSEAATAPAPTVAAPTPVEPTPTPVEPAPAPETAPPPATATPVEAPVPAPAGPVTVAVTSLSHTVLGDISSPHHGVVARTFVQGRREVRKNDKLVEITRKLPPGARAKQLAARVKELESLAEADPVYKPFLDKARADLGRARGRTETILVKARRAGLIEVTVARGDRVEVDQPVASMLDARSWVATAPLSEPVAAGWSCAIAVGARRGACDIEQVEDGEITVRVDARKVRWLRDRGQTQQLVFEPPAK